MRWRPTRQQPVIVRVLDGTGTTEGAIESVTVVKCNPGRVAEIYPKGLAKNKVA
jgi:hypothetical protein